MSETHDDGGPAFPANEYELHTGHWRLVPGMSLRDYFAAQALAGMNACMGDALDWPRADVADNIAQSAYEQADAMLAERARVRP